MMNLCCLQRELEVRQRGVPFIFVNSSCSPTDQTGFPERLDFLSQRLFSFSAVRGLVNGQQKVTVNIALLWALDAAGDRVNGLLISSLYHTSM